jgi:hypothetical protein
VTMHATSHTLEDTQQGAPSTSRPGLSLPAIALAAVLALAVGYLAWVTASDVELDDEADGWLDDDELDGDGDEARLAPHRISLAVGPFTIGDAARAAGVNRSTVHRALAAERLPGAERGADGNWLIPSSALVAVGWLEREED